MSFRSAIPGGLLSSIARFRFTDRGRLWSNDRSMARAVFDPVQLPLNFVSHFRGAPQIIAIAFCLLTLCACFSSTPSISDARKLIEDDIKNNVGRQPDIPQVQPDYIIPNGVSLVNLHKTNGQSTDYLGVKTYQLFYEGQLEFNADGYFDPQSPYTLFKKSDLEGYLPPQQPRQPVKKGDRKTFTGIALFQLTENGWMKAQLSGEQ